MNIIIDAFEYTSNYTGVGRFIKNILEHLPKIDKENNYTALLREDQTINEKVKKVIIPSKISHTKWENSVVINFLKKNPQSLFFSPNHSLPFRIKNKAFMTIHDVSWKACKKDFSLKEAFTRDIRTKISIKKALNILTVSDFSKQEIERFYPQSKGKVKAIKHGIENHFKRPDKVVMDKFMSKYKINPNNFIIGYLGTLMPRRHLKELAMAFTEFNKKFKNSQLIIIGNSTYKEDINSLFHHKSIIRIKRLEEEMIIPFYSSLNLFAYLSSYEGFGFPPLEALCCETPVLLLKGSSLSEIYKDYGYFIDNAKVETIRNKLISIHENLNQSKKYLDKFKEEKQIFSWEQTARKYLDIINSIKN